MLLIKICLMHQTEVRLTLKLQFHVTSEKLRYRWCIGLVVVVCLPRPMEGMVCLQLSYLFTELPVLPHATGAIGTHTTDCAICVSGLKPGADHRVPTEI